jgi:hypothetical protein
VTKRLGKRRPSQRLGAQQSPGRRPKSRGRDMSPD